MAQGNKIKEPKCAKVYVDNLIDAGFDSEVNVLLSFLSLASRANNEDGGQMFSINGKYKKDISKRINVTVQTIERLVVKFTKMGVIKRIQPGYYQLNPNYFGLGDWKTVQNAKALYNGEQLEEIEDDDVLEDNGVDW